MSLQAGPLPVIQGYFAHHFSHHSQSSVMSAKPNTSPTASLTDSQPSASSTGVPSALVTTKASSIAWSSLTVTEHAIKIPLYTAFVIRAVISAKCSITNVSYVVNSLVCILALWMVKGEVNTALKRLQRQLPPGYLGFPIHREIKLLMKLNHIGLDLEGTH